MAELALLPRMPGASKFLMSKPSMLASAGVRAVTSVPLSSFVPLKKFVPGDSDVASSVPLKIARSPDDPTSPS